MTQDPKSGSYFINASEKDLLFDAGHAEGDPKNINEVPMTLPEETPNITTTRELTTIVSHEPKPVVPDPIYRTEAEHQRYLGDLAKQQMELQLQQETLACTTHVAELSRWVVKLRDNALAPEAKEVKEAKASQEDYRLAA